MNPVRKIVKSKTVSPPSLVPLISVPEIVTSNKAVVPTKEKPNLEVKTKTPKAPKTVEPKVSKKEPPAPAPVPKAAEKKKVKAKRKEPWPQMKLFGD